MADYTLEADDARLLVRMIAVTRGEDFSLVEIDRIRKLGEMFEEAQDQVAAGRSLLFSMSP